MKQKTTLVNSLIKCGFNEIEVGSLVNPNIIPAMADSINVYNNTLDQNKFKSFLLVGNSINTDIKGSFLRFNDMINLLDNREYHYIKGYISCIGECPYEGNIPEGNILSVINNFNKLGVNEICIADTIGTLQPKKLDNILKLIKENYSLDNFSLHLHVEDNSAIWKKNLDTVIKYNIHKFDTSILGIGDCPVIYSKKKSGNLNILDAYNYLYSNGYEIDTSEQFIENIVETENILKSFTM